MNLQLKCLVKSSCSGGPTRFSVFTVKCYPQKKSYLLLLLLLSGKTYQLHFVKRYWLMYLHDTKMNVVLTVLWYSNVTSRHIKIMWTSAGFRPSNDGILAGDGGPDKSVKQKIKRRDYQTKAMKTVNNAASPPVLDYLYVLTQLDNEAWSLLIGTRLKRQ